MTIEGAWWGTPCTWAITFPFPTSTACPLYGLSSAAPIGAVTVAARGVGGRCVSEVLEHVAGEGAEVMVATHNQGSIESAVTQMGQLGHPAPRQVRRVLRAAARHGGPPHLHPGPQRLPGGRPHRTPHALQEDGKPSGKHLGISSLSSSI